jgi:trk system potassium uptake protein TrkH
MAFDERIAAVSYTVRGAVLAKYLGQIGLMLTLLCVPPLLVSLLYVEHAFSWRFLAVIAVLLVVCIPAARLPTPTAIQTNEGLSITALTFALTPLLMSYPLMAAGLPFADALFEAVSAVTTTGLSTLHDVAGQPKTFLFARAWMQWFGGLGIVVLSVSLLMGHEGARRQLIEPDATSTDLASTTRTHARRILAVYLVLSAVGLLVIWLSLGDGFAAVTLMLSAVSTGGFTPFNGSLASLAGQAAAYVAMCVGLAGAISIPLYYRVYHRGWRSLAENVEWRALLVLVVALAVLLTISLRAHLGLSWGEAGGRALLLGMSAQSTTGFSSLAIPQLDDFSKLLIIPAMLLGGSLGSTAGGIKLLRLLILLRLLQLWLRRSGAPPHAIIEPWLGQRKLESDEIQRALLVVALFVGTVVISWLVFVAFGLAPLDALFEVVSATATVGLSSGITAQELHPLLKALLCLDMLAGRVEVLALLVLLFPGTWFGKRTQPT